MRPRFLILLQFALQFPWLVVASIFLGFSSAIFNGINTTLLVPVLLQFLGQEIELKQAPKILEHLLAPFEQVPENYRLIVLLLAIVSTIILKSGAGYIDSLVNVALRRGLMNRIREAGFKILLEVDIDFYNKSQIGDISRKINGESSKATHAITSSIRSINVIATILMFLGILIALSWRLTLISSVLIGSLATVSQLYVRRAKYLGQRLNEQNKAYSVHLFEVLNGIRLIRTVGSETREYDKLVELIHEHEQTEFKSQMVGSAVGPLNEIVSIIILILIVILGRTLFAGSLSSVSTVLLIYLIVLFRLLPFVGQLNAIRTNLANAAASVDVIYDFLRRDNKPFMPQGTVEYQELKKAIRFDRLSFAYPQNQDLVIKDISLTLPRGRTLALVGSSGSGKSTLANLLARFYDPTQGAIYIDGVNLKDFNLASLRKKMGIVSQETFLFNDSVWNNVAYARPEATEAEILVAAKRANAYDFIQRLPQGWQTNIGDRGVMLSGGQRQRISIARALLQDPDILILDEATSALDTVSERLVQKAIDELSYDRTTLVIAHRLSTIREADQIAVLSQGEVVELGTHDQLLHQEGEYYRLWQMQFGKSSAQKSETPGLTLEGEPLHLAQEELGSLGEHQQLLSTEQVQLAQDSYQMRTYFNSILGSLRLLVDGMADDPVEQQELAEDAYQSAIGLLQMIETIEKQAR